MIENFNYYRYLIKDSEIKKAYSLGLSVMTLLHTVFAMVLFDTLSATDKNTPHLSSVCGMVNIPKSLLDLKHAFANTLKWPAKKGAKTQKAEERTTSKFLECYWSKQRINYFLEV